MREARIPFCGDPDRADGPARDGDRARQQRLFGEMTEACTACHARYAPNRFPALAE